MKNIISKFLLLTTISTIGVTAYGAAPRADEKEVAAAYTSIKPLSHLRLDTDDVAADPDNPSEGWPKKDAQWHVQTDSLNLELIAPRTLSGATQVFMELLYVVDGVTHILAEGNNRYDRLEADKATPLGSFQLILTDDSMKRLHEIESLWSVARETAPTVYHYGAKLPTDIYPTKEVTGQAKSWLDKTPYTERTLYEFEGDLLSLRSIWGMKDDGLTVRLIVNAGDHKETMWINSDGIHAAKRTLGEKHDDTCRELKDPPIKLRPYTPAPDIEWEEWQENMRRMGALA